MRLIYGSYQHDDGEVTVSISRQAKETDAGIPYALTHTWQIQGQIQGASTTEVRDKILALERAYTFWNRNLRLVASDGTVLHELPVAGSISGVRVIQPPSFPDGAGAQYTTYRDYTIIVQAEYPYGPTLGIAGGFLRGFAGGYLLKRFSETVSFSGGGPKRAIIETINTPPILQLVGAYTAYRATQSGIAVGYLGYPPVNVIAPPLWPRYLMESPKITRKSAVMQNGIPTDFEVTWSYEFASPVPLYGGPNQFPAG